MPLKVIVNQKEISFKDSDFKCEGGEGQIWVKDKTAYKIYLDHHKMIPLQKIKELSQLNLPTIVRPNDIVFDMKNNMVGYSMSYLDNVHELCKLFNKAFKTRENIDLDKLTKLIHKFYKMIEFIHSKDVLVVDLNENNFLVNSNFDELYAIDTNSYQTKSFPATAIMEYIRDRHSPHNKFSINTDWFSWAIVSFNLFIGIHPYKGSHPKYTGTLDTVINQRMIDNVSVYNKDVSIPKVCEPTSNIPPALNEWYKAVFEKGIRACPPSDFYSKSIIPSQVGRSLTKTLNGKFVNIVELDSFDFDVIDVFYNAVGKVIITKNNKAFLNSSKTSVDIPLSKGKGFVIWDNDNNPLYIYKELNGKLCSFNLRTKEISTSNGNCDEIVNLNNSIYIRNNNLLIKMYVYGSVISGKTIGNILNSINSKSSFDGCFFHNLLGRWYGVFFRDENCYQVNFPEFDKKKIISAKYRNNVLFVYTVDFKGNYENHIVKFENNMNVYKLWESIPDEPSMNFEVNNKGTIAFINTNDELILSTNNPHQHPQKIVKDPVIRSDMYLTTNGNSFEFHDENKLYSISLK